MVAETAGARASPPGKAVGRRLVRRAGMIAALVAILLGVLAAAVRYGPTTAIGRELVVRLIDGQSVGRFGRLAIQGLDGDIWREFSIARLSIADRNGVWIEARDVRMSWDPGALLGRRVHIRNASIRLLVLNRRPTLTPASNGGPSGLAISLDSFAARAETAPAISQVHGVYDVKASVRLERNGAAAGRISAASVLHPGDFLSAVFDVGGKGGFRINMDALEAQGGALAGVAGLRADQPFSLTVRAAGDGAAGRFTAVTRSGPLTPLQASGAWSLGGGSANGQVDLTASRLLAYYAKIAGPAARFQIQGRNAGDGFDAVRIALDSANIQLVGTGELDFGARRAGPGGLSVDLHVQDPNRILSFPQVGAAHLWGTVKGESSHWLFAGAETIDHPSDSHFNLARVAGPLNVEARLGEFDIDADLAGEGGAGQGLLAALLGARPTAKLKLNLLPEGRVLVRQLDVSGSGLTISASGDRTLFSGLSFKGSAVVSNLPAAHQGAAGVVKADWTASQSAAGKPWSFSFDAHGDHFASGQGPDLDRLLGDAPRLRAEGDYQDGVFAIANATLDGATGAVDARGHIGPNAALGLALVWSARGPMTIGPLEVAGSVKGKGDVGGSIGDPRADLTADFSQIDLPALPLVDAHLALSFARGGSGVDGHVSLSGESEYGAASGAAAFRFVAGGVDFSAIDIDAGGVSAAGSASLRDGQPSSADLSVAIGPGALLQEGRASGRIRIVKGAGEPRADLSLSANSAVLAQGAAAIRTLRLTASGPLNQLPFSLAADGATPSGPWRVSGDGALTQAGAARTITFSGSGHLSRVDVRTLAPAQFEFGPDGRRASLRLSVGAGQATVDVSSTQTGVDAKASISGVDLDVLSQDYVGRFSANLALEGKGETLNGLLDAKLAGAGGRDLKGAPPVDGEIRARLQGRQIVVDATLGNNQGLKATSNLTLPADASAAPFRLAVDSKRPMSGVFAIDGELKPVWDLLMGGDRSLAGHVVASGSLAGTLADPRAVGNASLENGQFRDSSTGLKLQNVNMRATLANNAIDFSQFAASDGARGQLSGGGRISLLRDGVSTLRLELAKFRLLDNDYVQASASGQVNVNRAADGHVKLAGDLTIDHAQISPISPVATGVVPMDVVEIHNPEDVDARFVTAPRPAAPVALDMHLHSTGGIIVKGRGLNLELSLDAQVGGSTASPVLSGTAHVVRGDYNFAGQRFQIDDRGVVHLGSTPQTIRLDLTATREDPTLTAVIRIQGTAAKPTITLTSTPVLPQDEVLSQVLFGASASQLTALQAAQLASAVSGLASGGGFDVIGGLRNFAHLDRLAIGTNTTTTTTVSGGRIVQTPPPTGTTVSGGKYLTDTVYLEVIGGREGSGAQVEWRIRKHVALVSRLTSQGDSQVSIRWRKDY